MAPFRVLFQDLTVFWGRLRRRWWYLFLGLMDVLSLVAFLVRAELRPAFWIPMVILSLLFCVAAFDIWRSEYHRVQELETADAKLEFDPTRGEDLVGVIITGWNIAPGLIPKEIGLQIWFFLRNMGTKIGILDKVSYVLLESQAESPIVFRPSTPYCYPDRDPSGLLLPPKAIEPERPLKVACQLSARIAEKQPKEFAQQLGNLEDPTLVLAWAFHGVGESIEREIEIPVDLMKLRQVVTRQWEDKERPDLVKIARRRAFQSGRSWPTKG